MIALLAALYTLHRFAPAHDDSVTVRPGVFTFAQLADRLKSDQRRVLCEPALKRRACAVALTSRSWEDVQNIFSSGLGLVFEKVPGQSVDTYRLVEPVPLRQRRAKMRKQLLKFYAEFDMAQTRRVLALIQNANGDQATIQKTIDDLDHKLAAIPPGPERTQLEQEESDLGHALGYAMWFERFGIDAFAAGCPDPPVDLAPPADYWADMPLNETPTADIREIETRGEPGKFRIQNCLFRWHLRRTQFGLSFGPEWVLVGPGCQNSGGSLIAPDLDIASAGKVLDQLNGGDAKLGWKGFGELAETNEEDLNRVTKAVLAEPEAHQAISEDHIDSVPGFLLSWSKLTKRDFVEELNPQADSIAGESLHTLAEATAKCPQIALKAVRNCIVGIDKLQFLDEALPLATEAVVETRRILESKKFPDQIPADAFRVFVQASSSGEFYPWLWLDYFPTTYLGVPIGQMVGGSFAFSLWDRLVRELPVSTGRFWLNTADPAELGSVIADCQSSVQYYQDSLPGFLGILSGEDLVVDETDTAGGRQVRAHLEKHAPNSEIMISFFRLIKNQR